MYIPLEDGEEIVLTVHRHWIFIAARIVALMFFVAAPAILGPVLEHAGILKFGGPAAAWVVLWALWILVGWGLFWQFWTTYYMDIWVVTNRRIIDIDYQRLFDRNIAILRLDRVQDVTTHVEGILATLLRYGAVRLQSAGAEKAFVIDQIANPELLRDAIIHVAGKETERLRGGMPV